MSPRKRTSVFLDPELMMGLKALKARDGMPEAEAIRRAIAEFLATRGIAAVEKAERKRPTSARRS
jgi:predicted DNA-binding protein